MSDGCDLLIAGEEPIEVDIAELLGERPCARG